jgi:hypothetical protein
MIFVFGSNERGVHGAGAARHAMQAYGAQMGTAFGPTGEAFAIPTKDHSIQHTLPLERIGMYVAGFLYYACNHPELTFQVTRIGCGLAGLNDGDVAMLFDGAPSNCLFDYQWKEHLPDPDAKFWGSF